MSVVVIGDLVTDVLATLDGPLAVGSDTSAAIRETGGGSAANTACWLASTGTPATLVAVVGDDPAGRARVAELSCDHVVRFTPEAPTGTVIVLSVPTERTMVTDRGANTCLTRSDVDAGLRDARHVHLSGYVLFDPRTADAGRYALAAARERGATTSVDASSAEPLRLLGAGRFLDWIAGTDLLLANLDEAYTLVGIKPAESDSMDVADTVSPTEVARTLGGYVPNAVVKLGGEGALWARSSPVRGGPAEVLTTPAAAATAIDPTGAGDAFAAGLLTSWLAGGSPAEALIAGARLGAKAVATAGARP